ncbi:MAG TPA: VWA domain-containing protein [Vicinamibacterales bacterium]|nr:VWA domain-containing protein [Vicinamibacterales bacterium]
MRQAVCFCVLVGVASLSASRQVQPPAVRTTTTGVVMDVSVLDGKGQPILDLVPADFEVSEDGVKQQILSLRLVQRGVSSAVGPQVVPGGVAAAPGAVAQPAAAAEAPVVDTTPSVTAILFDRLSPEVRPLAHSAALAYVATLSPPHDYAGVFLADASFKTFQPFTNKAESLRQGIDRVASTAPVNLAAAAERAATTRVQAYDPNQPPTAGAESAAGFPNPAERQALMDEKRDRDPAALLLRLELKMEEGYLRFASEYEGQASMSGLRAVVDALSALPGRKSVLYFTENLQVTTTLKPKFDALIGQANRANITVYTVDAAGLRVHSKEAELGRNVSVAGQQGIGDERRGDGPWTKELERQDQLLSSRPTAVLGRLAKETGGFLLENTNNLAAGVARMQQERTTYYLLAYQPTNTALDGTFRKVSVKVKRSKTTVKARPGYLAVPARQPSA